MPLHQSRRIYADHALLSDGWHAQVVVDIGADGMISSVCSNVDPAQRRQQHFDWSCRHLLPAICNLHSHAFQRAMAGCSERLDSADKRNFWGWREHMYRLANALTPDSLSAISRLAYMEMLEAGFAAVAEFHYVHHAADGCHYQPPEHMAQGILAAAADSGIGLCLLPVLYTQADADGSALAARQLRFGNSVDDYLRLLQAIASCLHHHAADTQLGMAAHSLRAVSPAQLQRLLQQLQPQQPLHIHVAEQIAEVASVQQHLGLPPLQWLLENTDIDQRWCLVHATHATTAELKALQQTGCCIGLCPQTEANLGDGVFALPDWLALGGHSGVGTDANIRISVSEELRLLEYTQRLLQQRRQVLQPGDIAGDIDAQGEALYRHALRGGAQALQRRSGVIASGHWADLLHLDGSVCGMDHLNQSNLIDGWLFAAGPGMVRDVWSAGRHVVVNGRHVQRQQICSDYATAIRNIQHSLT